MKLIIASNNAHKLKEIKAILGDCFDEIVSIKEAGIDHETVEDGSSFYENAHKKASEIMQISGCCALADDSGICVDALGGAPGIFSARFSGVHGDDKANNRTMLEKLSRVENRKAHYTCCMVLVRPDGSEVVAEEIFEGVIGHEPVGDNGFGYDPLFFIPEYNCTMAQLSPEVKNSVSHRAKALQTLLKKLK